MASFALTLDGTEKDGVVVLGEGCLALPTLRGAHVASQHVRLCRRQDGWYAQDLATATGTLLNGVELYGAKRVRDGDVLGLANAEVTLRITGTRDAESNVPGRRRSPASAASGMTLRAQAIAVRVPGKALLEDVSFIANGGEFIGILGPSGCGKSTLLKAIAGLIPACDGSIWLRQDQDDGRAAGAAVAYLPQDVIIHDELVVEDALSYISAFKAIAASDLAAGGSVESVVAQVRLSDQLAQKIESLSGGQKKRVGLAAELLGNPEIILLDEATSGLDPATDAELMELFRGLADAGKTVICVTHNPARLSLCHRVLFLSSGRLLFDGPPQELVATLQADGLDDVYRKAVNTPVERLLALFPSRAHADSLPLPPQHQPNVLGQQTPAQGNPSLSILWVQLRLLAARYGQVILADWRNLVLLLGQAPAIALIVVATFGRIPVDFAELHAARLKEVFLIQVLAVLWCSGTASVREIVKEWPLLRHEQRYGLSPGGVLLSKFILLSVIAVVQVALLTIIVKSGCGIVGDWMSQLCVLSVLGCIGVAQGLLISALAGTSERAMTILPVILIGEAIVSGGFAKLTSGMKVVAQLVNPAYWALDGLRSTLTTELLVATYPGAPGTFQPAILGLSGPIWHDMVMLAAQGTALVWLAYLGFRRGLTPQA